MDSLSREIIGRELASYEFCIERGKVREFCLAIGETNPIFTNPEEARKEGYEDTPLPPTFPTAFEFWGCPTIFEDIRELGIDTDRLLHLKQEYTYLKPLYPGNKVKVQTKVSDVRTGKMDMVTFQSVCTNEQGEKCLDVSMGIFIRPKE